jgi:DNA-binding transcriptional MocR family regulator
MKAKLQETPSPKNLYERVADRIQGSIEQGTLQPGDRLPSVRTLREQMSVSISTVLEAYRLLEDRGAIEARPQSGYFVKSTFLNAPDEPNQSTPPESACAVDASLAFQVSSAIRDPKKVKLGSALPNVELMPLTALNRLMGQVLRRNPILAHAYDTPPGCFELRHEIARRLIDAGCSLAPEQLLVTNGTTEAIHLSLRAVTQPGDTVAIESPTYYGLLESLSSLHLQALELPTHPRDGISLPHLEAALKQQQVAACAIVSNFSNPLGSCMSEQKKQQLVDLCEAYQCPLIEDDIYGDLYFSGKRPKALKAFDRSGLVLYCASYSKTLSPGLRVGWAAPGRYQAKVERLKLVTNQATAVAPQLTLAAFLANGGYDRHLRKLRRAYQGQVMRMTQTIREEFPPQTRVTRPTGGHVLWVELPVGFDAMRLYHEASDRNISIAPGVLFSPSGSYNNCFRLNCGVPWSEEIAEAMKILGSAIAHQFI